MKGNYAESVEELAKFQELIGGEQTAALMRESFAKGGWKEFLRAMTDDRRPANLTPYNVAYIDKASGLVLTLAHHSRDPHDPVTRNHKNLHLRVAPSE